MKIKFKVVGGTGNFKEGGVYTFYDDSRHDKITIALMHLLPEYFMEIQPEGKPFDAKHEHTGEVRIPDIGELCVTSDGRAMKATCSAVPANILRLVLKPIPAGTRFNDKWEYAGKVDPSYVAGETYVFSEESKTVFAACRETRQDEAGQLLRPIEKSPTKQEIITALEGSIRHWLEDILPLVLEGDVNALPLGTDNCPLCQRFYDGKNFKFRCGQCPIQPCNNYDRPYSNFYHNKTFKNACAMIEHLQKCKDELVGVKMTKCTFNDKGNGTKL